MIMTAELNSHQRVSYYTGVKLIRHHHHHHQNSTSGNGTSNSSSNSNNANSSTNSGSATTSGGYFHHHPLPHYPQPPLHIQHLPQQPPLPPHHPGHFHLPCPTGPPHLQHPGSLLHLSNHHGPPPVHHPNHFGPNNGGGTNQATRMYAGSPLIRSTVHHSSSVAGNQKKSYKNNHNHSRGHHNHHNNQSQSGNYRNAGYQNGHHQNSIIIGRSCSSGSSSSSSSNEQLNNLQSPAGSPIAVAKLDISSLKLASPPVHHHGTSSSSNTSSPGPEGSPSPSTASNSSSGSLNSADGNKDLDHFYFLEEHWKPSSEGSGPIGSSNNNTGEAMDTSSLTGSRWTRSNSGDSPSPPAASASALTLMVDQIFGSGHVTHFGTGSSMDGNNFNGDMRGTGTHNIQRDSNNNLVMGGGHQVNFNETPNQRSDPDPFNNFSSTFSNGGSGSSSVNNYIMNRGTNNDTDGQPEFFNFCGNLQQNYGDASSSSFLSGGGGANTTMVNVETQIGTFNGQRDLEIRLCFIKTDQQRNQNNDDGPSAISYYQQSSSARADNCQLQGNMGIGTESENAEVKLATAIGDPFISSTSLLKLSGFEMEEQSKSIYANKADDNGNGNQRRESLQAQSGLSEIAQLG